MAFGIFVFLGLVAWEFYNRGLALKVQTGSDLSLKVQIVLREED